MDALNRVQGVDETRGWVARYTRSLLLAVGVAALVLLATAVVTVAPLLYGDPGTALSIAALIARWGIAAVLVLLSVGLLVRHGPNCPQSLGWVSIGAGIVVGGWLAMSAAFLVYLTTLASYGSLFGNLATLVVLMGYLYASSVTSWRASSSTRSCAPATARASARGAPAAPRGPGAPRRRAR